MGHDAQTCHASSPFKMIPFITSFLLWAVLHSFTASQKCKDLVRQRVGDIGYHASYRFVYNVIAVLSILPVFYFYWSLPDMTFWRVPSPWPWLMISLQVIGLIGAAVSVIQTDALSFIGLRQLLDPQAAQNKAGLGETLYIVGLYRWMRHPLYTFSMMILWFSPIMTRNTLIFNLLATSYFIFGSIIEERRLTADFGQAYIDYQAAVPRFLPKIK